MKRLMRVGLAVLIVLAGLAVVLFVIARERVNDGDVPIARSLLVPGQPKTVLAVWAHPDDEITSAGTLARMAKEEGARLVLVYMTRGEAAKDLGYTAEQLATLRPPEAQAAGKALGAARVVVLDYPDGGLPAADSTAAKASIRKILDEEKPSVVISFDERVGFYGHPDHAQTGRWVRAVVDSKRAVLDAHRTQVKIIADVQPGYDRVPAWIYYRLFDREYYAEAVKR